MHHLLKIIPLVVLLIASYYFYDWVNIQEKTELTQLIEAQPVFTAKNINTRQFNPDGRLYQSIFAREAEYYQSIEQTNFVSPVVLYTPTLDTKNKDVAHLADKVSEELLIQADSGTVSVDNLITLRDNVIVKSSNENSPIRELKTSYLEIDIGTDEIRTPAEVTLKGKHFTNSGRNLKGLLSEKYFELSEDCHATYTGFKNDN